VVEHRHSLYSLYSLYAAHVARLVRQVIADALCIITTLDIVLVLQPVFSLTRFSRRRQGLPMA